MFNLRCVCVFLDVVDILLSQPNCELNQQVNLMFVKMFLANHFLELKCISFELVKMHSEISLQMSVWKSVSDSKVYKWKQCSYSLYFTQCNKWCVNFLNRINWETRLYMQLPGRVIQIYLRCCSIKVSEFFFFFLLNIYLYVCMYGWGRARQCKQLTCVCN